MVEQQTASAPAGAEDEIEGIDTPEDGELGAYPLDTMLIRTETRTVRDVLHRIGQGRFIMDPDFQRGFVWSVEKQSKLIESVAMRIPLPVFYVAENEDGKVVVVDGLQRLFTFKNFVEDGSRLSLPSQPEIDGKLFAELSAKLQNRIEDCNLILYIIDAKAPERARLDIFERVNGGVPLTRQQMRNCLNMGPATRFLRDEADLELFREVTGGSLNRLQMRDREFVNRFCGFQLFPLDDYSGDMDDFLSQTLKRMNTLNPADLDALSKQLRTGLLNNHELFGRYAFRKHTAKQEGGRRSINASLWDVMCTGLARYDVETVNAHKTVLLPAFYDMLANEDFNAVITSGTNQAHRVKRRFAMTDAMLRGVFGA